MKRKSNLIYTGDKSLQLVKRRKLNESQQSSALAVYESSNQKKDLMLYGPKRTSSLKTPIIQFKGHIGEVFSCEFSNVDGKYFASCSFDKKIFLWNTFGDNSCVTQLTGLGYGKRENGHRNAILDIKFNSTNTHLYSVGVDKMIILWDIENGNNRRLRKIKGHESKINSISLIDNEYFITCSDDGCIKVWDKRYSGDNVSCIVNEDNGYKFPVLCVDSKDNKYFFSSDLSNDIKCWDLRTNKVVYKLQGHENYVTGVKVSNDMASLASNSKDGSVKIWDIKSFCEGSRLKKSLGGISHGLDNNLLKCSWSKNDRYVSAGSSDTNVYVWDARTGNITYKLPGHKGTVNDIKFHPKEPIILSASSDCTLYLGEIDI